MYPLTYDPLDGFSVLFGDDYPDLKEIYINGHKALHGKELNIAPTVINNSMYVGIRDIAELFGAEVEWNQEDQKAMIKYLIPRQEDSE